MSFTIKQATRQGIKPLIGLYSESGCGKTYSALLVARGFAGPNGKIVMIDSEEGRGSAYADEIPGGYDVIEISEPFTPQRYVEAIVEAEKTASVIVVDSASHEWEGPEGVCDQAGANEEKSGKAGLHNWRKPKLEHQKFVQKLLRSKCMIVVCVRAKYKTRQTKDASGKTIIVKDDMTSPIQADDFIFEMMAHGEILHSHAVRFTKVTTLGLRKCLPDGVPLTIEHGKAIAAWCNAPTGTQRARPKTGPSKAALWKATQAIHGGDPKVLAQYLWDEALMDTDGETLETLSEERFAQILKKLEKAQAAA